MPSLFYFYNLRVIWAQERKNNKDRVDPQQSTYLKCVVDFGIEQKNSKEIVEAILKLKEKDQEWV